MRKFICFFGVLVLPLTGFAQVRLEGGGGGNTIQTIQDSTGWTKTGTNVHLTVGTDNLGVGTTSPISLLHINNAAASDTMFAVSLGSTPFWTIDSSATKVSVALKSSNLISKDASFGITGSASQSDNMITVTSGTRKVEMPFANSGSYDVWKQNVTGQDIGFWWEFLGGEDIIFSQDGEIGIGLEPGSGNHLNIEKASNAKIRLAETGGSEFILTSGGGSTIMYTTGATELRLGAGGAISQDMIILSNNRNITINDDGVNANFRLEASGVDSAITVVGTNGNVFMEGLGSGTGTALSRVSGTDQIVLETSSKRYKKNIKDWRVDIKRFMRLKPRKFKWNDKVDKSLAGRRGHGMIAEEVVKAIPAAAQFDNSNKKIQSWDAHVVLSYTVGIVQKQQKQIDELVKRLDKLERRKWLQEN